MPEPDPLLQLRGKPCAGGHRLAAQPCPQSGCDTEKVSLPGFGPGRGRLLCPGAGRRGQPAQRPGAGGGPAHVSWSWLRVDPPHAGGLGASCCAGREGGAGSGPSTGAEVQGRRVSGVRTGLTQLGLRGRSGSGLALKSEREKVSNGTDVRPLTPTLRVPNGTGGVGTLLVVPGAPRFGAPEPAARIHGRRLRVPAASRYSLPGRAHRTLSPKHLSFRSRSAFRSSLDPHPDCRKISFKFSLRLSNVHEGI